MLIEMIYDSPGEPAIKTHYRDPAVLRAYGYEAIVIPNAIPAIADASDADTLQAIAQRIRQAEAAGMQVFFYSDALILPRRLVDADPASYLCEGADLAAPRLCPAKPAVLPAFSAQITQLFERFPQAAGLVLRTFETPTQNTPHLLGTPLHEPSCPVCRTLGIVPRLRAFITAMHDLVVARLGRTYVHRTFQRHGPAAVSMHDDPAVYREITAGLPHSDRFCFSFKFTRGEFRQGEPPNPCLTADSRPKWIEFQCEREFEGKGAFPNYQPVLWADFLQQMATARTQNWSFWGWLRGGGWNWGGPYVQREEWIDANVVGLSELARNPAAEPGRLARQWAAAAFQVDPASPAAGRIAELLLASPAAIRQLLYDATSARPIPPLALSAAAGPPAPACWVHNDLLDVDAMWDSAARLLDPAAAEAACAEKLAALAAVERLRQLFDQTVPELPNKAQARDLANTLVFYNSFAGTLAHLYCGFIRYFQYQREKGIGRPNPALAERAVDHLEHAQAHWQHNTQRHALLPGAPSVFQETTFWERSNACLEELAAAG